MLTVIVETKGKMKMKKTLIAFAVAAAALTSVAVAGGYAPAPKASQTGVYIEGMVGGAYHIDSKASLNALGYLPGTPLWTYKDWSHSNWGWALGADIGYQFDQYLSAELGGFWVQKSKWNKDKNDFWMQNWLGYLAGKVSVPVMDNFDLFAKFGIGLNHSRWSKDVKPLLGNKSTSHNFFGPVFAVGGAYTFGANQNMALSLQYMRFGQSWTTWDLGVSGGDKLSANAIDLVTVGLSYKFAL